MSTWKATSVAESLSVMMQKEQTVYRSCDYLHPPSSSSSLNLRAVDAEVRTKMVDWCYSFIDTIQVERESVAMAMEMVDRFLSKPSTSSEAVLSDCMQYQLLAVTALYVAVKTTGVTVLGIDFFCCISNDLYSMKEIEAMERTLLHGLSWCISAPTCVQMAHHILTLISADIQCEVKTWNAILDEVMFQAEHAVREYYFVTQRPSTVAMAAIFSTLELFDKRNGRAFVRSLLSILNDDFDSLEIIMAVKNNLNSLVYGNDSSDIELLSNSSPREPEVSAQ
jgi:hypothetical protein